MSGIESPLLITMAVTVLAVSVIAILFVLLRDRSKSRYDEFEHRAILSEMRNSFEEKIRNLQMQLMGTQERWKDINHLLLSAQEATTAAKSRDHTQLTEFFRSLGVT